jgi:hypothetical protein
MKPNKNMTCKIWGFHGGDYDDYHLPEDNNHQEYNLLASSKLRGITSQKLQNFVVSEMRTANFRGA